MEFYWKDLGSNPCLAIWFEEEGVQLAKGHSEASANSHIWQSLATPRSGFPGQMWAKKAPGKARTFPLEWSGPIVLAIWIGRTQGWSIEAN